MRFPKLTELDKDQRLVYEGAPVEGTILVVGPPGTGKTVIAFHRAQYLTGVDQEPTVLMYNQVLWRFTSDRDGVAEDVNVQTLHQWAWAWWRRVAGGKPLPTHAGDSYQHDWPRIQQHVIPILADKAQMGRASWGHLIIDEGQDFQEVMYTALRSMLAIGNANGAKPALAVTVLADDNQRLNESRNATVDQIRQGLGLHKAEKNVFSLRKNYRNTFDIAKFASHFYVGLPSGQPDLPERKRGALPVVSISRRDTEGKNINAFVEKIAKYAKAHRTEEIGVLVPINKVRSSVVNRLESRLKAEKIVVQSYARGDDDARAEDLVFDKPGHVTVLNFQSAKGLEFDAVFIVDASRGVTGGSSELNTKMTLYVMCSRARRFLNLMLVGGEASERLLSWLPSPNGSHVVEELQ